MIPRLFLLALSFVQVAQPPVPIRDGQTIPLWTGAAPGALGSEDTDIPAITVFLPRTLAPDTPAAQGLLVQLTQLSARMVSDANIQDRSAAAADARDLLQVVARLRAVLGLPPS